MSVDTLPESVSTLTLPESVLSQPQAHRVLTGDRPTGRLHVGHYFGTLQNRVRLQNQGVDLLVLVADYQVLTDRDSTTGLSDTVEELVLDYLAVGIRPEVSTVFAHSAVPALNQLLLPFLSLVSTAELDRNPTVKEEIAASRHSAVSGLMYTYPVHQAADILFCGATLVPVGDDQLPHLELTRTIARRFNTRYRELFPVPRALLSAAPRLRGLDGSAKMGKSAGNSIPISATADETARLIRSAVTDTRRVISYEPQTRPQVANLLLLAGLCAQRDPAKLATEIGDGGAARLKAVLTEAVNEFFAPIRRRRAEYAQDRSVVRRLLAEGNARANELADATLRRVNEAMGTRYC